MAMTSVRDTQKVAGLYKDWKTFLNHSSLAEGALPGDVHEATGIDAIG
jgi:hypothetical protein